MDSVFLEVLLNEIVKIGVTYIRISSVQINTLHSIGQYSGWHGNQSNEIHKNISLIHVC